MKSIFHYISNKKLNLNLFQNWNCKNESLNINNFYLVLIFTTDKNTDHLISKNEETWFFI